MTTIQIELPDALARDAQRAGLLSASRVQAWLQDQLATQRVDALFGAIERMSAQDEPAAMSPEEVAAEIEAMRAERRASGSMH
jgi:hypothetical protein